MNPEYVRFLNTILNLVGIGFGVDRLRARVNQAVTSGELRESEVPAFLDKLYDEARQEALNAQPGDPEPPAPKVA